MDKIIYDKELGTIAIHISKRARRYSIKVSKGIVKATMPISGDINILRKLLHENRDKIRSYIEKSASEKDYFDESTEWHSLTFKLRIFKTDRNNFYMKLEKGILHIACPAQTDFRDENSQLCIRSLIERALRHEAKLILPQRLNDLAVAYKFNYKEVKITKSKTRWGSCSGRGSINLSLSLMLLPQHLIDYVLLHELCHTKEMNHSDRFWKLMDTVTAGKAFAYRKELKSYKIFHV